jgi:hypothetical protein
MINTSVKERKNRQTLKRISITSIARKIVSIFNSPSPSWGQYDWLVKLSKNDILVNELKSAEQIDVLDTPSTFDRMSDMSNLIEDQKTISKALAHLNELREEPKAHKIRAYDENVTRTFARN